ncbi:hypothetical protein PI124_g12626 [Phytophthora idaei]|nr:hypothetical protein PI124_g12626 [Phytophthora idaei]
MRYRKKKENYTMSLEVEVDQLRQKIEELEQRRRSVYAAVPAEISLWSVVAEYFRLFRFGVHEAPFENHSPSQLDTQLSFLQTSFTTDVAFNASHGVGNMIQNWQQISRWFPGIEMELDRLQKDPTGSLVVTMTTTVCISEQTIRVVFSHLHDSDGNGTRDTLAHQLLDQTLIMRGSMHFEWSDTCHRITRVSSQSDMLTPMVRLLGSLEAVPRVFE